MTDSELMGLALEEARKAAAHLGYPVIIRAAYALGGPEQAITMLNTNLDLDISDYAKACRFKDCKHINEPGCAVLEAVNSGLLDAKVYESYLKLRREAWHFSASEHEKRKKEKSFTKLVEEVKKRKANR